MGPDGRVERYGAHHPQVARTQANKQVKGNEPHLVRMWAMGRRFEKTVREEDAVLFGSLKSKISETRFPSKDGYISHQTQGHIPIRSSIASSITSTRFWAPSTPVHSNMHNRETSIKLALEAIENGTFESKAAKDHKILRSTLCNRCTGRIDAHSGHTNQKRLSPEQEDRQGGCSGLVFPSSRPLLTPLVPLGSLP